MMEAISLGDQEPAPTQPEVVDVESNMSDVVMQADVEATTQPTEVEAETSAPVSEVEQQQQPEATASVWSSWTATATASWKQAVETTGEALDMSGDILSSTLVGHTNSRDVVSGSNDAQDDDEESSQESDETPEQAAPAITAESLVKSFQWGWSSVVSQAEAVGSTVVDKSMASFKAAEEVGSSVVEQTRVLVQEAREELTSQEGWSESGGDKAPKAPAATVEAAKSDAVDEMEELSNWDN